MKKLSALMLGAAMVLSTAAFAGQTNKPATDSTATKSTKKTHVKKGKKSAKKGAPAATPATPEVK